MTWTRLDDNFADDPDLIEVSRSARLLHVEALIYGNRHGNDGRFRRSLVPRMTDADDWKSLVDELLGVGIWEDDGDFITIDWTRWWQEPSAKISQRRENGRKRKEEYNERTERHRAGDHSKCTDRCRQKAAWLRGNASRNGDENASQNAFRNEPPSHSDPVLASPSPSEEWIGQGEEEVGSSAGGRSAGAPRTTTDLPPIGISPTSVHPVTAEDYDANPGGWNYHDIGHTEISIELLDDDALDAIDDDDQREAATHAVGEILKLVHENLTAKVEKAKKQCDCEGIDNVGCAISAFGIADDERPEDRLQPSVCLMIPTSDYAKWQSQINGAIKNAVALATTWRQETA